jgi:hypothetical protein
MNEVYSVNGKTINQQKKLWENPKGKDDLKAILFICGLFVDVFYRSDYE